LFEHLNRRAVVTLVGFGFVGQELAPGFGLAALGRADAGF
jgi:hypothetical protein